MGQEIPLGKPTSYPTLYDPSLLFAVTRHSQRSALGIAEVLPFVGFDVWNAYEVSWLNLKGKPQVAIAEFIFPCETPSLIESKSFKLYLNSFNDSRFDSQLEVINHMEKDLSDVVGAKVQVSIIPVNEFPAQPFLKWQGTNIDTLDVECNVFEVSSSLLQTEEEMVSETLVSDLLKSNCLVTGQPDWASVKIEYKGAKINHESLLRYFVSYRQHQGFHESCVEQIFMDIMRVCQPKSLLVEARYTRRGGLDINPVRATELDQLPTNLRLCRQ